MELYYVASYYPVDCVKDTCLCEQITNEDHRRSISKLCYTTFKYLDADLTEYPKL